MINQLGAAASQSKNALAEGTYDAIDFITPYADY